MQQQSFSINTHCWVGRDKLKLANLKRFTLQENGHVGDEFMNKIQPIAAYVPYMTSPGNHEEA